VAEYKEIKLQIYLVL